MAVAMGIPAPSFPEKGLFVRLFGGDVYAVGGYVRDWLRGAPHAEVDLLVARRPLDAIVEALRPHGSVDLVGRSFGVIKFTLKGRTYDVALPRVDRPAEVPAGPKSHKDIVIAADPDLPVEKDLQRRDFRCNSMALRLSDATLLDPFGGAADVRARRLRVTDPRSFPDDPLRVLRAGRFASVLEFRVDPSVYELARDVDLSGLSVERVDDELFRILLRSPRPSRGLRELFRLGVLEKLFPELYRLTLVIQDALFHPETDEQGHHTVFPHAALTVDQAKSLAAPRGLDPGRLLALLLAALYHDTGKATTTRWEYKRGRMTVTSAGHDVAGERMARRALQRQKIFTYGGFDLRRMVPCLIRTHHRASELWLHRDSVTRKAFNRLAAEARGEIDLVILLDAADRAGRRTRLAKAPDREARWMFAKFEELRVNRDTIRPLVMGRDLIALGVAPGPGMGKLLKRLYRMQLDNVFQTRAGGREAARKILAEGKA